MSWKTEDMACSKDGGARPGAHDKGGSVGNPCGHDLAQGAGGVLDADDLGALERIRKLGGEDGGRGVLDCVAEPDQDASDDEHRIVHGRCLKSNADQEDRGADGDGSASPELLDQGHR